MGLVAALAFAGLAAAYLLMKPDDSDPGAVALAGDVTFYGNPQSPISGGVVIPANRATMWTSGTVPGVADQNAERGTRERYGDTYTQAASILSRIEGQLEELRHERALSHRPLRNAARPARRPAASGF